MPERPRRPPAPWNLPDRARCTACATTGCFPVRASSSTSWSSARTTVFTTTSARSARSAAPAAAHAVLGDIEASDNPPRTAEALEFYDSALRQSQELGLRPLLLETRLELSRLNAALGEAARAKGHRTAR